MKELIAINLNGKFRWSEYAKDGNHDRKFGPTVSEYVCQIPVAGLVPTAVIFGGIYTVIGLSKAFSKGL